MTLDPALVRQADSIAGSLYSIFGSDEAERILRPHWSDATDPVSWIETYFHIEDRFDPTTGDLIGPGPINLAPYQKRILRAALKRDADGRFRWTTIVLSMIKKSGKTRLAAAIATWVAATSEPFSEIYFMANDGKQSEDRLLSAVGKCLDLNSDLDDWHKTKSKITLPNGTFLEAIPVDPSGQAGANPTLTVASELWGFRLQHKQRLWTEMTLSSVRRGKSFRLVESYAGYVGESPVLERLYNLAINEGTRHPDFPDLPVYVNETARLFCFWDTEPRMPWQTPDYYCLPLPDEKQNLMVLCRHGWKPAAEVTLDDELCTMGQEQQIEYQRPKTLVQTPYRGSLLRLRHHKCDLVMTPNHRVLAAYADHMREVKGIRSKPFVYEYRSASEARHAQCGWIPGHGIWKKEGLQSVTVEGEEYDAGAFCELIGWFASEGYVHRSGKSVKKYVDGIGLAQSREKNARKYQDIARVCKELDLNFSEYPSCVHVFNARLGRYFEQFGKSGERRIPRFVLEDCSQDQQDRCLRAVLAGDGTRRASGSWIFYSSSLGLAQDVMELSFKCGWRPRYLGTQQQGNSRPIHRVSLMRSHIGWSTSWKQRRRWGIEQATEGTEVWCPVLPNGNFYAMQNGVCWWTGNSEEAANLPESEFRRIHKNEWVTSIQSFVPLDWWEACKVDTLPPLNPKDYWVFGVDAAVSGDCFGIVGVTRLHAKNKGESDKVVIRYARAWTPPKGGKILFTGPNSPEAELTRLCQKPRRIAEVAYDPYQLERTAMEMRRNRIANWELFGQGSPRLISDSLLFQLIRDQRILHDGSFADLTQHIQNADAKMSKEEDNKMRLIKGRGVIDLAVSLSMAAARVLYLQI